jgi:hypothetical protein
MVSWTQINPHKPDEHAIIPGRATVMGLKEDFGHLTVPNEQMNEQRQKWQQRNHSTCA